MAEPMTYTDSSPDLGRSAGTVSIGRAALPPGSRIDELLIDTAESIGGALGSAVHRVGELQQLLEKQFDMLQERTRSIQGPTREIASAKVAGFKGTANDWIQGV